MTTPTLHPTETRVPGLHALGTQLLPFAPTLEIRAFLLERDEGNVLIYGVPGVAAEAEAFGVTRHYLGHGHEASVAGDGGLVSPLFVHAGDRELVEHPDRIRGTFTRRHTLDDDLEVIPIPGHTPGSTAYLWDSGEHRVLFTADTLTLQDGEWQTAVLSSSDPAAYAESLKLIRGLDFDVLAPWAASAGGEFLAATDADDTRRRIDALLERL